MFATMCDATRSPTPPPPYEATESGIPPSLSATKAPADLDKPVVGGTKPSTPASTMDEICSLPNYWLVQVDRDWRTGRYGEGIRLYHQLGANLLSYVVVRDQTVNADGSITINATNGKSYLLVDEPNIDRWARSEYAAWKLWDAKNGADMEEDRPDYEPWAYKTLAGFADGRSAGREAFYRGA